MSLVIPFDEIFSQETGLLARHSSWERFPVQEVARVLNGDAFKSKFFSKEKGCPLIRIRDLSRGKTETFYTGPYEPMFVVNRGDILIGMDGDFACHEWDGEPGLLNQRVCKIIPDERVLDRKFFLYGINGYLQAIKDVTSSQTVTHLSSRDVLRIPFPVPTLSEQKRIVASVDALLARVNAARQRLAKVPAILKRFRQSVLAAACSGRLSADWRRQQDPAISAEKLRRSLLDQRNSTLTLNGARNYKQPVSPDADYLEEVPAGWPVLSLDELTILITSGSRDWSKYYGSGRGTFIMAQNVRPGSLDMSFRQAVDPPKGDRDRKRSQISTGDILVTIVGANTGDVWYVDRPLTEHYVCQSVAMLRPINPEFAPYLNLFLNCSQFGAGQFQRYIYGEGRPHLGFDQIRTTAVAFPPLSEQREIVCRVEVLFRLADAIERRVTAATARAEKLTQAILAKAFRGELVPTEAELARREGRSYEPAFALLERIRAERVTHSATERASTRNRRRS
jgi:type I restriction enzyme S subunit